MNAVEELIAALRAADVLIGFSPLPDERDFSDFLKENRIEKNGISVIADRSTDPIEFAETLRARYASKDICIFIPGREFDETGTRHGRGGGWYDRFLSKAPREWLRIGVLEKSQLSSKMLKRESWDEPMDYLLVHDSSWTIVKVAK
jgi:5-formyltetrahydrofolate cyclo-ligase